MPPPLTGRRIVLTRAAAQAGPWLQALRAAGADAVSLPTILIAPPADPAPLDAALAAWGSFDGIIFTSANAVQALSSHALRRGLVLPPSKTWLCAIGSATAAAVSACGWRVDIVPAVSQAEGVIEALLAQPQRFPLSGRHILFPRAAQARTFIPEALRARGAIVSSVACYRTQLEEASRAPAQSLFPGVEAVVLTSPSAARNLAALLGPGHATRMAAVVAAAIGPTTHRAVAELGWPRVVQATQPAVDAIINALREYWHA